MTPLPADTPRRLAPSAIILVLAAIMVISLPMPAAYADYCEVIGCWPECRPVPGGRVCREVCRRRCWRSTPRYVPPPAPEVHYAAPSYAPVSAHGIDPVPVLLLAGVVVIVALVIAAAASGDSATAEVKSAADETERQTADTRALAAKLQAAAREADAHLDRFLADTQHRPR